MKPDINSNELQLSAMAEIMRPARGTVSDGGL